MREVPVPSEHPGLAGSMALSWWREVRPRRDALRLLTGAAKALPARQSRKKIHAFMVPGTLQGERELSE